MKLTNILFFLVSVFLLFQINLFSQGKARLSGRVTDASTGDFLPGANIILEGTNLGTASDRFGNYKIEHIPLGSYTLKVSYIGYKDYTENISFNQPNTTVEANVKLTLSAVSINEVVVNGLLQGQVKALNQQKNSVNIVNVLSREEMEKFPDLNTADVLQRIPGVNISKSLGEGSFVYLRGTEPRLTNVTVDGQKLASSDDEGRFIDLGVINSSQLSSVEVNKTLTPDMDADAIGGTVNLVTKSPFDYEKPTFTLDVGGGYANLENRPLYRASAAYTGFFGNNSEFGYTISGSYYRNNIIAHSDEADWDNVEDVNGNTIPFALTDSRFFRYNTRRDHYGVSTNLEYKYSSGSKIYFRGLYNQLNDDQSRNMVRYRISKGDYLNATTVQKARLAFEFQDRNEKHKISSLSFGGVNNLDNWSFDYDLAYSYGIQTKTGPGSQIKSEWQLDQKANIIMDISDVDFPKFNITNFNQDYSLDPSHWEIDNQDFRENSIGNNNYSGTVNIKYPYVLGSLQGELKLGGKINIDQKDRTGNRVQYKWKGSDDVLMSRVSENKTISDFLKGNYTFGPLVDNDKIRSFYDQYGGKQDGLRPEIKYLDSDGEGGNYNTKENIYAGYLMTTLNFGAFNFLAGARDEYTKTDYKGVQILLDNNGDFLSASDIINKRNYNNIFPYFHLTYKISSKANARFAVTRTIARPNYFDLAPYNWIDPDDGSINRGNPNLKPTFSTNIDLTLAYYFQGIGVISGGFFYKNLTDVTYHRIYQQIGGAYDGFDIEEPVNGGDAKLYGAEFNWQEQFSFLPGFFSGFGIYGNYTYTKSEAKLLYREWNVLPGQAGDVGNVGISYERNGVTARLSLNYTSKVLDEVGETPDFDRYTDNRTQLDFTGIYQFSKFLSVYVDLINITNADQREYVGISSRPRVNEFYGFSMRGGVKINL